MRSLLDFKRKKHKTNTGLTFVTFFKESHKISLFKNKAKQQ